MKRGLKVVGIVVGVVLLLFFGIATAFCIFLSEDDFEPDFRDYDF